MNNLPAAPGKASSAPEQQGLKGVTLCGRWLPPATPWVLPDPVHLSAAAGVLFSNRPTVESTGKKKIKKINAHLSQNSPASKFI